MVCGSTPKGFKINQRAIKQMTRELQKEFDKNPVHLNVEADPPTTGYRRVSAGYPIPGPGPAPITNNYNVSVSGDNAQVVAGNTGTVNQQTTPSRSPPATRTAHE